MLTHQRDIWLILRKYNLQIEIEMKPYLGPAAAVAAPPPQKALAWHGYISLARYGLFFRPLYLGLY